MRSRRGASGVARKQPLELYELKDVYSSAKTRWVVVGKAFCGLRCVGTYNGYYDGVNGGWMHRVIHDWHVRNYPRVDENNALHSTISGIKESMLQLGATSIAVDWIGELSPFTEKELSIMASKLKTKGETTAKAAPAEKAPKPVAAAKKGNPAALEKAHAAAKAKSSALRASKIKALVKPAELKGREGTFRRTMLQDVLKAKTVGEFMEMDPKYDAGCLRFAESEGYISVG